MKKIIASLLTAYVLTNGQAPPVEVATVQTAQTVATSTPQTTAAAAATTAARLAAATSAGATSAPGAGTTKPATTAAATTAATTAASVNVAPVNVAPVNVAPVNVAPAPITPAPVTPAPITPPPTLNPYCPLNAGEQSGIQPNQFNENRVCFTPNEVAVDYLGRLRCEKYACCQCAQINCGFDGYPCEQLQIGDWGATGTRSINIRGAPEMNNNPLQNIFGGNAFGNTGAKMECTGKEGCKAAIIRGELVREAQCSGDYGCQDAKIVLNDPAPQMNMQCSGLQSCERADIEINVGVAELRARAPGQACNPAFAGVITELGKVEFNGRNAGSNAIVTIRNHGCGTLIVDAFECMSLEACPRIAVNIEGNVAVRNCDLMGVAPGNPAIQSLVAACQAGQNYANWSPGNVVPTFPMPGQPTFPMPPAPQQPFNPVPVNPVNPTPVNPTPVNPFPVAPAPGTVFPGFGLGMVDPRASSMQCDMAGIPMAIGTVPDIRSCANKDITLQIANNFVLDCSLAGACTRMTLTLNAGMDPTSPTRAVERIDSLKFIQPQSDVTVYINSDFGGMGQPLRINDIRCEGPNTCRNLKIIAGPGVDILSTNYDCNDMMACLGGTVTQVDANGLTVYSMALDPRTAGFNGQLPPGFNPQPQVMPGQQAPANPGAFGQAPASPQQFNPWV